MERVSFGFGYGSGVGTMVAHSWAMCDVARTSVASLAVAVAATATTLSAIVVGHREVVAAGDWIGCGGFLVCVEMDEWNGMGA